MIETFRLERPLLIAIGGMFMFLPMAMLFVFLPQIPKPGPDDDLIAIMMAYVSQHRIELISNYAWVGFGELAVATLLAGPARPTVGEALSRALRLFPWFLLQRALVLMILMGGATLFLLPGIYLAARLSLCTVLLGAGHGRNPMALIQRSFDLTRGAGWHIAVFIVLMWLGTNLFANAVSTISATIFMAFGDVAVAHVANGLIQAAAAMPGLLLGALFSVSLWRTLEKQG